MPPQIDPNPLDKANFHRWAQDGDVMIGSGAKSGTAMLHQLVYLLRSGGKDDFELLWDEIGSMELMKYPEHLLEDRISEQNSRRKSVGLGNQQWFTHLAPGGKNELYGLDPEKHPGIKYLCISRNGKEVVRSFFHFINAFSKPVRDLWGGVPFKLKLPQDALNAIAGHSMWYFDHVELWWAVRNAPNVLLLHFTDVLSDKRGTVRTIAEFLGIELTEELLSVVLEKSSHKYMQKNSKKYIMYTGYPGKEVMVAEEHVRQGGGAND
jgi:aryl sulfotransferase